MKFLAAVKDPETGRVFSGRDHALAAQSAMPEGKAMASRVFRQLTEPGSPFVGFVDEDGNFFTRKQSGVKFGFSNSETMWEKGMGMQP